jgi:hypothetical protein
MEEAIAIEKIRNAVEIATKKLIVINDEEKINQNKDYEEQVYSSHKSFLNAMIYHELVSNNCFVFNDVHMEYLYPEGNLDEVVDFHIENIFTDRILEEFYMEVKHIRYGREYEAVAIPRMMNSVIDDMDKLEAVINFKNSIPAVGIMVVVNLTRYPGNSSQYEPMNIMIDCLKKLLTQWKYSDDIVFILSDNFRAIAITAGEIKRYEA